MGNSDYSHSHTRSQGRKRGGSNLRGQKVPPRGRLDKLLLQLAQFLPHPAQVMVFRDFFFRFCSLEILLVFRFVSVFFVFVFVFRFGIWRVWGSGLRRRVQGSGLKPGGIAPELVAACGQSLRLLFRPIWNQHSEALIHCYLS